MLYLVSSLLSLFAIQFSQVPSFEADLRDNALPAWKRTVADMESGIILFDSSTSDWQDGFVAILGSFVCSVSKADGAAKEKDVFAANDQYEFWLQKKPANAPDWKIRNIHVFERQETGTVNQNLVNVVKSVRANTKYRPYSMFFQGFISLVQAVEDPRFSIVNARRTEYRGQPCIEYEWNFDTVAADFPESGKFWVNPSDNWNVLRIAWNATRKNEPPVEAEIEFDNFERCRSSTIPTFLSFRLSQDGRVFSEYRGDSKFRIDPDSKLFYLSNFGFPEPIGVSPQSSGLPWWLLGVITGVVLIGIASLIRHSSQRKKS